MGSSGYSYLLAALPDLDPSNDDFVLQTDELVANLAENIQDAIYDAILRFFERHPEADCGAPGTLVHHIESYYPNYVRSLRESVRRAPSYNGVLLINRILNSNISESDRQEYLTLLRSVMNEERTPDTVRDMAGRYLHRQEQRGSG
jgi:hypothetical protein